MIEPELHYIFKPDWVESTADDRSVDIISTQEFLRDEPACKQLWQMLSQEFRTRSKFLAIWPAVRYLALHRDALNEVDGLLLISAPVNWQIDYVVVDQRSRGQGIAGKMLRATLHQAKLQQVPYVMLTSKESLRKLYESCGFQVIQPQDTLHSV